MSWEDGGETEDMPEGKGLLGRPWDPRAALAVLATVGTITIQGYILTGQAAVDTMPNWLVALVSSIVSYYFGAKNGTGYKNKNDV